MKIVIKVVAALALIMGLMAVITGSRVLLGLFDPGYQYYALLVIYNIIFGILSIITGFLIWQESDKAPLFAYTILGAHLIVLVLLKTVFNDIISVHSVNAMTFRVIAWAFFSFIIWKSKGKKTQNTKF